VSFEELKGALEVLHIPPLSTYKEIKKIYKEQVFENHPDIKRVSSDGLQELNSAFQVVQEYIESYRFYFTKEEFEKQFPEERHARRFNP